MHHPMHYYYPNIAPAMRACSELCSESALQRGEQNTRMQRKLVLCGLYAALNFTVRALIRWSEPQVSGGRD